MIVFIDCVISLWQYSNQTVKKKTKAKLYTAVIKPMFTYGCETWTTTNNTEKKLRSFENK